MLGKPFLPPPSAPPLKIINQTAKQTKSLKQKQHNPYRVAETFMCR